MVLVPFLIGSHTSSGGGVHNAAKEAGRLHMQTFQLFTKNNNQWQGKPISSNDVQLFKETVDHYQLKSPIAHTSYLINLASPNVELHAKSVDALAEEWRRAEMLGLTGLVMHPGSATDKDEIAGIQRVIDGIEQACKLAKPQHCRLLLENTAGQGTALGWKIEHLHQIISRLSTQNYIGICIDSCHAHAAGYDLSNADGLERLAMEIKQWNLADFVLAIHLNDSLKVAGSRVDRHAHLTLGTITEAGLQGFINHPLFRHLPMVLETEKGAAPDGEDWDLVNMRIARRLAGCEESPPAAAAADGLGKRVRIT